VSFRRRLLLAVVLLVVVPVAAIGLLLARLSGESRTGKADAQVAGALPAVLATYQGDLGDARAQARQIGRDPRFGRALAGRPAALRAFVRAAGRRLGVSHRRCLSLAAL